MRLEENGEISGTTTCLWSAMVHYENTADGQDKKVWGTLLQRLGMSACMHMQEIGITPSPDGWIVNIRAAGESGRVDILIPQDRNQPVKVLQDTRTESQMYDIGNKAQ